LFSCLVVLWQIVIFCFSSQTASASSDLSGGLTKRILGFLFRNLNKVEIEKLSEQLSFVVRKSAHFTLYFVLGMLMYLAINKSRIFIDKMTGVKVKLSFLFCFLYSVSDEIHQFFVPGRALRVFDVFVDSVGSIFGILIVYYFIKKVKNR